MSAYLFVHFKEKTTSDGEQVYFGISQDGLKWEAVNAGQPVLWAKQGEKGVRDHTIVRSKLDHKFYILATDLCLANTMEKQYQNNWERVAREGSVALSIWESEDLIHWSDQKLIFPDHGRRGCHWAPDVLFDAEKEEYVLHWSAPVDVTASRIEMAIWYSRTKDFRKFYDIGILYASPVGSTIDSAIYEEAGQYFLFVKSEDKPKRIQLLSSSRVDGPYQVNSQFDRCMEQIEEGMYEAPTAVRLEDGRWCLFLDYYGKPGAAQGYVPFIGDSLASGNFIRSDECFSFPYGFKHGTILTITDQEYERIKGAKWDD